MEQANVDDRIVDFGGGDGYIERRLREMGYNDVHTVNVGDKIPHGVGLLVMAEVLEHIYEVRGTVTYLMGHLKKNGKILIELPDARRMVRTIDSAPLLDYQQKHVNHFTPEIVNLLFSSFGYFPLKTETRHVQGHTAYIYRAIYERLDVNHYETSHMMTQARLAGMREKLERLGDARVVVWGCGDIAMHMLSLVRLNVAHYVDIDPAYRGATIGGVPVFDHVESDDPIVVIAQGQRDGILAMIAAQGLKNEVIVI
jgi:hypothetical protein